MQETHCHYPQHHALLLSNLPLLRFLGWTGGDGDLHLQVVLFMMQ
jgi:hypothetical protein